MKATKEYRFWFWGSWVASLLYFITLYFSLPLDVHGAFVYGFLLCWLFTFWIRFLKAWTRWHTAVRTGFDPKPTK